MRRICTVLLLLTSSLLAQRLPQTVVPSHYKLSLDPNIEQKQFSGDETIDVSVKAPVQEIVLNSLDLDISEAEVISGGKVLNANVVYAKPDEMVRLQVPETVAAGQAQIHLKYAGKLAEGLRGLYLSKTPRREYAVTQFEGTYARMMFPCFDEPAFKATFDLTTTASKDDTAISNGRIIKDEFDGNRHRVTFSTSPKMSTYLVALAIGDWQCLSRTVDDVPIRVCAVPEKKEFAAFALDVAAHSIQFYNQWYGIKYPFGKLDMLAIPDYEWGGMENTASIFYRDSALLLDERNASVFRKRGQAVTIAHEIAHQWFGDLVTAAWWDDIWLNEGFATWMARKPIEAWHPEWHLEDDAAAEAQQIIGVDSLPSARAIHGNPSTPSEIKEMFDGITYEKGAAILRMLEGIVGSEGMRKGVNAYLAAHANGNATSADFWQAMAQTSGGDIDRIMPTFVLQPGVPVVTISNVCIAGSEKLEFTQGRFLISGGAQTKSEPLWQIPFRIKTAPNWSDISTTLAQRSQPSYLPGCPPWIFGNGNGVGYYRSQYTSKNLEAIAEAAEKDLSVPERIVFVEDAWAMTRADKTSVADFLDVSQRLSGEQDRHVVDLLANHLQYVEESLVSDEQNRTKFKEFLRAQFGPLAKRLGWEPRSDDTDEQRALRSSLLEILGGAGDPDALEVARNLVQQYMREPSSVDATLAGPAFSITAENGDSELYRRFTDALNASKSSDEYYHYLYALADFRKPELLEHTVALIDQGKVRQQDYPRFFGALLGNPGARDATWKYLKDNWNDLSQKVTSFGGTGAVSALGNACSVEMRDDVKQFFEQHPAPGAQRAVQQSLNRINNCIEFKQAQEKNLHDRLAKEQ